MIFYIYRDAIYPKICMFYCSYWDAVKSSVKIGVLYRGIWRYRVVKYMGDLNIPPTPLWECKDTINHQQSKSF